MKTQNNTKSETVGTKVLLNKKNELNISNAKNAKQIYFIKEDDVVYVSFLTSKLRSETNNISTIADNSIAVISSNNIHTNMDITTKLNDLFVSVQEDNFKDIGEDIKSEINLSNAFIEPIKNTNDNNRDIKVLKESNKDNKLELLRIIMREFYISLLANNSEDGEKKSLTNMFTVLSETINSYDNVGNSFKVITNTLNSGIVPFFMRVEKDKIESMITSSFVMTDEKCNELLKNFGLISYLIDNKISKSAIKKHNHVDKLSKFVDETKKVLSDEKIEAKGYKKVTSVSIPYFDLNSLQNIA